MSEVFRITLKISESTFESLQKFSKASKIIFTVPMHSNHFENYKKYLILPDKTRITLKLPEKTFESLQTFSKAKKI